MGSHLVSAKSLIIWAIVTMGLSVFTIRVQALIMRPNGPEPVIVQVKDSLRLSLTLDAALADLASLESQAGVTVVKRFAGQKYLELLSFPADFSEEQAISAITQLEAAPMVEKVVAFSAFNLEFQPSDLARGYAPADTIPDAARRGLDANRIRRTWSSLDHANMNAPHLDNQLIVAWKPDYIWNAEATGFLQQIATFNAAHGCTVIGQLKPTATSLLQLLQFDPLTSGLYEKLAVYSAAEWVDYVQPNYLGKFLTTNPATDPMLPGLWHLDKIHAPAAWSVSAGDPAVTIANADSGVYLYNTTGNTTVQSSAHPDLANVSPLSTAVPSPSASATVAPLPNPGGTPLFLGTTDVDGDAHGTHTASVIGAIGDNGEEMTGVAKHVTLMHVKIADQVPTSFTAAEGIQYAADNHATAVNCSFSTRTNYGGGYVYDDAVDAAIDSGRTGLNDLLVVCAAGNDGVDLDSSIAPGSISPASDPPDNVLSVAATDTNDALAHDPGSTSPWTNFGQYSVDLAAPGAGIWGLTNNRDTRPKWSSQILASAEDGTSMSAPQLSGAAALIKTVYPWETYAGIRDRLLMSVDTDVNLTDGGTSATGLTGRVRTSGRLNVARALGPRTVLSNVSTRARVESGDTSMIGGFIIGPTDNANPAADRKLDLVIRGLGSSLAAEGISNPLSNPRLTLTTSDGKTLKTNDGYGSLTPVEKALVPKALVPSWASDAVIVISLPPGKYTAILSQRTNDPAQYGVGRVEIYAVNFANSSPDTPVSSDISAQPPDQQTRLVELSTRCKVGTGEEIAIAGTIPNGVGDSKRRVLARGLGETLSADISNWLADPKLTVFDASGSVIDSNDNWTSLPVPIKDELSHPPLPISPGFPEESVVWPTFGQSKYTVQLEDTAGRSGIGLVELYEK